MRSTLSASFLSSPAMDHDHADPNEVPLHQNGHSTVTCKESMDPSCSLSPTAENWAYGNESTNSRFARREYSSYTTRPLYENWTPPLYENLTPHEGRPFL